MPVVYIYILLGKITNKKYPKIQLTVDIWIFVKKVLINFFSSV